MRRSHRVAIGLALAVLSAGCYRTSPFPASGLPPAERVRLEADDGFRFVPMDSSGVMAAESCRARHLTARVMELRRDTLFLGEVAELEAGGAPAPCRRTRSAVVVPSEHRSLRIGVIEPTPRRAFVIGFLAGPVAITAMIVIMNAMER